MKINNYEIFDNQTKAGEEYFELLIKKKSPVLCSQPQMGKTGTLIFVVSKILDYCIQHNIDKFKIYHIQNFSDLSVKDQTDKDYREAFESNGFKNLTGYDLFRNDNQRIINIIHHPELSKIQLLSDTTYFILIDECHASIIKDGLFDKFCARIAMNNINWYKGYCSATPFTYDILEKLSINNNDFKHVVLEPSSHYMGIDSYFKSNRLRKADYLILDGKITDFAINFVIPDFVDAINVEGNGFLIIRGKYDSQILCDYIKLTYEIDVGLMEFNSDKGNLSDLELKLNSKPKNSEIIIIKGALRLGKRLNKNFIRCICDTTEAQNAASVVQSLLGRVCGNDVSNKSFNIYCDLTEVEDYTRWWDDTKAGRINKTIPSSRYNKSNITISKQHCNISFHTSHASASAKAISLGVPTQIANFGKSATISGNLKQDISEMILNKSKPSQRSIIYKVDGPNLNANHKWQNLINQYGSSIINQYVLFEPVIIMSNIVTINPASANLISKNSMFN